MAKFRENIAIVIGINSYQQGIPALKTAVNDAEELAQILQEQHGYTTLLFLDQTATRSTLLKLLTKKLPSLVTSDDRCLFYFAGHGIALNGEDGPEGYLIPQDARLGDVSTYLPMSQVHKALHQLPCRHFLGILDCCFAGAFRWSSTRKLVPVELGTIHKERFDRFIQDPAWQILTSAAYDQTALDAFDLKDDRGQTGEHSPFAAILIEALEGKADAYPPAEPGKPAGDGVLTATELYLYLRDRIEVATEARAMRQTPGICPLSKHDKGEYIFLAPGHELNLPPAPPLDDSKNPYRGLEAFEEEHCELFFGRKVLTQKLYEFVISHSLTVVLGASGSGKSSLVKAGLISKLRKCKGDISWSVLPPFRPGESPFRALNNALAAVNLPEVPIPGESTPDCVTPPQRLAQWFEDHPNVNLLLVVDQFEELITLCRNDKERQQFLESLATAITAHPDQLHLVLTLRSDFEPQFRNTALEQYWQAARFVVPAMTREELRQAIEEPASARVMYFNPHELVDQLIDEVAQMPGALPLLSFALSELYLKYLKRQDEAKQQGETIDRAITQADYEEVGGVTRSLTQRADQEYEALVQQDKIYAQTIRHVMLRMVAVGGELARRRVLLSELEYPVPENSRVQTVIQRFSAARLLVSGTDEDGNGYVEPAHDVLVRGWQRLLEWKQQDLSYVLLQRELTPIAHKWAADAHNKQAVGLLWANDPRLPLVKQVRQSPKCNWLNTKETHFIDRSFQRRRNNRRRFAAIGTGAILVLSGLTLVAFIQRLNADTRRINAEITAESLVAENLFSSGLEIDALVAVLKIGQTLKQNEKRLEAETRMQAIATLREVVYGVRQSNRLEGYGPIKSVNFSPDGETIIAGTGDGTVKRWNLRGKELSPLYKANDAIRSVVFSPEGKTIVASTQKGMLQLWDSEGHPLKTRSGECGRVDSISFSPNSKLLVFGCPNGTVKLWNLKEQEFKSFRGHSGRINSVSFSPNGKMIASASSDQTIKLWSLDGQPIRTLKGHNNEVRSISFSPDSRIVTSGSYDRTLKLWNLEGKELKTLKGHRSEVESVSFSRDGKTIVSGDWGGRVKLWNLRGEEIRTLQSSGAAVYSVRFNSDGNLIASGTQDGSVNLLSLKGQELKRLKGHHGTARKVSFSSDGKMLASASADKTINLWNLEENILTTLKGHRGIVFDVSFSPDDKALVSASHDRTLKLWDLEGKGLETLKRHRKVVYAGDFSPNGRMIASGSQDQTVRLWDLGGQEIKKLGVNAGGIVSVKFSPNGKVLAFGNTNDGTISLWNLEKQQLKTFKGHNREINSVAFRPDGKILASASADGTIKLWHLDGILLKILKGGQGAIIHQVSFSRDGRTLASANGNGIVNLWSLEGNLLKTLKGHELDVYSVSFSPDGKTLASASEDTTIVLWNFNLDDLMQRGCNWLHDYLENSPNGQASQAICKQV